MIDRRVLNLARSIPLLALSVFVSGCLTDDNVMWRDTLSKAARQVNDGARSGRPLRADDLERRLSISARYYSDHRVEPNEPDATVPINRLPDLLSDVPWVSSPYNRYRDWVMGSLWRDFAANGGQEPTPFAWQKNDNFNSCDGWLYTEVKMPDLLGGFHDDSVVIFFVKDGRVWAACRISPWHAKEELEKVRKALDRVNSSQRAASPP